LPAVADFVSAPLCFRQVHL